MLEIQEEIKIFLLFLCINLETEAVAMKRTIDNWG